MHDLAQHIIANPSKEYMDRRSVMEGILKTAMLTPDQREDLDGMIRSAIPGDKRKREEHASGVDTMKVKPSATKVDPGYRHFPGSRFA